jgi:hypothetical protein
MRTEDYLPFYLGCDCEIITAPGTVGRLVSLNIEQETCSLLQPGMGIMGGGWFAKTNEIKPILRQLSDMSENDALYLARLVAVNNEFINPKVYRNKYNDLIVDWGNDKFNCTGEKCWSAEQSLFLLKCGYDLFGLIESGLAIEKTKTENHIL